MMAKPQRRYLTSIAALLSATFLPISLHAQSYYYGNDYGSPFTGELLGVSTNWYNGNMPAPDNTAAVVYFFANSGSSQTYSALIQGDYSFSSLNSRPSGTTGDIVDVDFNEKTVNLTTYLYSRASGSLTFRNGTLNVGQNIHVGDTTPGTLVLTENMIVNNGNFGIRVGQVTTAAGNASNSTLKVEGGSKLTLLAAAGVDPNSTTIQVGLKTNASGVSENSKLIVTGSNSSVVLQTGPDNNTENTVRIGHSSSGNSIEILNGGSFTMGFGQLRVGSGNSAGASSNNTLLVDGANSKFLIPNVTNAASGDVLIGLNAANMTNNKIVVRNGGEFTTAGGLRINGTIGSNNQLVVQDNGVVNLLHEDNRVGATGRIVVDGGGLYAQGLEFIDPTARLDFLAGSIEIGSDLIFAEDNRVAFDLIEGALTIEVGDTLNMSAGNVFLDIVGISESPATYTLFTFESGVGLGNFRLGNIPVNFDGFLSFDSNGLYLTVVPEPQVTAFLMLGGIFFLARLRRYSRACAAGGANSCSAAGPNRNHDPYAAKQYV